jgi:hypothetical protein
MNKTETPSLHLKTLELTPTALVYLSRARALHRARRPRRL